MKILKKLAIAVSMGSCLSSAVFAATWQQGYDYKGGETVTRNGVDYQCKEFPFNGWCGLQAYQPEVGFAWQDAWTKQGTVVINPNCSFTPTTRQYLDTMQVEFIDGLAMVPFSMPPVDSGITRQVTVGSVVGGSVAYGGGSLMIQQGVKEFTLVESLFRSPPLGCNAPFLVAENTYLIAVHGVEPSPTPPITEPEYVQGVTVPENGQSYQYQGACWQAKNNPGRWETPREGWFWSSSQCRQLPPPSCIPMPIPTPPPPFDLPPTHYDGVAYELEGVIDMLSGMYGHGNFDKSSVSVSVSDGMTTYVKDGKHYVTGFGYVSVHGRWTIPNSQPGCGGGSVSSDISLELRPDLCMPLAPEPAKMIARKVEVAPGGIYDAKSFLAEAYGEYVVHNPEVLYNVQVESIAGDVVIRAVGDNFEFSGPGKVRITGEYDLPTGGPSCTVHHVTGGSVGLTLDVPTPTPIVSMVPQPTQHCLPLIPGEPSQLIKSISLAQGESVSAKSKLMSAYYNPIQPGTGVQSITSVDVQILDGDILLIEQPEDDVVFAGTGSVMITGNYELRPGPEHCTVYRFDNGSVLLDIDQ